MAKKGMLFPSIEMIKRANKKRLLFLFTFLFFLTGFTHVFNPMLNLHTKHIPISAQAEENELVIETIGHYFTGSMSDIEFYEHYVIIADAYGGIEIFDILNPNQPERIWTKYTEEKVDVSQVEVSDRLLYVGLGDENESRVEIYNISSIDIPVLQYTLSDYYTPINKIEIRENYLFVHSFYEMKIYSLSSVTNPILIFETDTFSLDLDFPQIENFYLDLDSERLFLFHHHAYSVYHISDNSTINPPIFEFPGSNHWKSFFGDAFQQDKLFFISSEGGMAIFDFANVSNIIVSQILSHISFTSLFFTSQKFFGIVQHLDKTQQIIQIEENAGEYSVNESLNLGKIHSISSISWNTEKIGLTYESQGFMVLSHENMDNIHSLTAWDDDFGAIIDYRVNGDIIILLTHTSIEFIMFNHENRAFLHLSSYSLYESLNTTIGYSERIDEEKFEWIDNSIFLTYENKLYYFTILPDYSLQLVEVLEYPEFIANLVFQENFLLLLTVNETTFSVNNSVESAFSTYIYLYTLPEPESSLTTIHFQKKIWLNQLRDYEMIRRVYGSVDSVYYFAKIIQKNLIISTVNYPLLVYDLDAIILNEDLASVCPSTYEYFLNQSQPYTLLYTNAIEELIFSFPKTNDPQNNFTLIITPFDFEASIERRIDFKEAPEIFIAGRFLVDYYRDQLHFYNYTQELIFEVDCILDIPIPFSTGVTFGDYIYGISKLGLVIYYIEGLSDLTLPEPAEKNRISTPIAIFGINCGLAILGIVLVIRNKKKFRLLNI